MSYAAFHTAPRRAAAQGAERPPSDARLAISITANAYGLSFDEVVGPSRLTAIAHARQAAYVAVRLIAGRDGAPKYSLPRIGRFFGGRDHTSVLHGLEAHRRRVGEVCGA